MFDSVKQTFDNLSENMAKLQKDLGDLRDLVVSIKSMFGDIYDFLGPQTSVMIGITILFLIIFELIPFVFVSKRFKYYVGIIFGVWFGVKVDYGVISILKYLVAMILPLTLEYVIGYCLRKSGRLLFGSLKAGTMFTLKSVPKMIKKNKNEKEKQVEIEKLNTKSE